MSSVENILKRLRESRIQESESYEYKFDIPYRQCIAKIGYSDVYIFNPKQMDYLDDIVSKATEDFNDNDLAQYTSEDIRTEDSGITSMTMSFDNDYRCIITVTTTKILNQTQIDSLIRYLEAQMSDGWGEGFEQREIAGYIDADEEWVEGDDEEEGYYDVVDIPVTIYCQFWWSDKLYPWRIKLLSTPHDKDKPTNEDFDVSEPSNFDSKGRSYYSNPKDWKEKHEWVSSKLLSAGYKCKGKSPWTSIWTNGNSSEEIKVDYHDDFDAIKEYVSMSIDEAFDVIDKSDQDSGRSAKYRVSTRKDAEKRVKDLVDQGSDVDKISIEGVHEASDNWFQRDNSDYHKEKRKEEESHPYVGKYVIWRENKKRYKIDRAYDINGEVVVRCGNITMKPEEYTIIKESKELEDTAQEILRKIKDAVKKFMMSPSIGFPEDEVNDYSRVDVEFLTDNNFPKDSDEANTLRIEVGAELSYNALSDLCDELNPIIEYYTQGAYFEPEQPGIIVAYLAI